MEAPLLEREFELATIAAALERARSGRGGVLVIEGVAGIGKSSLLAAAIERAGEARVLTARAAPLERAFAFGTVRTLFDPLRVQPGWDEWTADAAGLALSALDPVSGFAGPGDEGAHATLHGLFWLAANLCAERPLLLVVDDAHWADAASLGWVAYLARRVDTLALLVLLAVRTGEGVTLDAWPLVRPRPLGPSAVATVVRGRRSDAADDVCAACHAATGGNPFLVHALAGSLDGADAVRIGEFGPEAVVRDVAHRLDRLPEGTREVARAVAILGPGAAPRQVAALADVSREAGAEAADALRAAGLLAPGARLEFAHPILAAAVAAGLGPGQTALWHRRAWKLVDGAERQALHVLEVEPEGDADAVATLRAAAQAATARGASESATTYLRRALAEPPDAVERPAVLLECGLALAAHRDPEAPRLLHEAVALASDRAAFGLRAAQALAMAALYDDVIAICHAALADTRGAPADLVARLETELIGLGVTRAESMGDCRARIARMRLDPPAIELWRVNAAGMDTFDGCPARETLPALHTPALALERNSLVGTVVLGLMLIWNDDLEGALAHADGLLAAARPRGWASAVANGNFVRAMAVLRAGRVAEALDDARASFEFKLAVAPPDSLGWAAAPFAEALVEHGELDAAEATLASVDIDALAPGILTRPLLLEARARLRLAQQRPSEALADARSAAADWALLQAVGPGVACWRLCAVEALVALDERDEARTLANEQLALAERHGTATSLAAALRAVAQADGELAPLERAVATCRAAHDAATPHGAAPRANRADPSRAVPRTDCADPGSAAPLANGADTSRAVPRADCADPGSAAPLANGADPGGAAPSGGGARDAVALGRLEHVRALVDLGAALRRRGRLEAAREPLREALHRADRDGAIRLAERARAELHAAGARPRREALTGAAALTPAERRVAALAAEGRTNRQIAQELFVTQRTVETHLTHTFAKLDITSRDALAAALWPAAVPA